MKTMIPTPADQAFRDDVVALLDKHAGKLDAITMLALASHLVGQLMAMQDQRRYDEVDLIALFMANAEAGNAEVIGNLKRTAGNS